MTKKVLIVIAMLVIFTIIIVSLILGSYLHKTNTADSTGASSISWNEQDIPTPDGYTKIEKSNIISNSKCVAEAIFFKEVEEDGKDKTLVRIHVQNRGNEPFSKDNVCTLSLYDANDVLLHRIGGIIEESSDIKVGDRTIINTQFLSKAGKIEKAEVNFSVID